MLTEDHVEGAVGVEGWIKIHKINRFVGNVIMQDLNDCPQTTGGSCRLSCHTQIVCDVVDSV